MKFNELEVGQEATQINVITDELIKQFAEVSGDKNPVHLNEEYASTTIFKKRIAHGMICASFISSLLGNELPGAGTIYLNQSLSFKAPVCIGDHIKTTVQIKEIRADKSIVKLNTFCTNQEEKIVLEGEAVIKFMGG
jgi:3-hydroxybutyryl-CoA dehydratase